MTIVLAICAGVAGLLAGGVIPIAARRSIDQSSPPLVTSVDVPLLAGRPPDDRIVAAVATRLATALVMVGVVVVIGVRWVLPAYLFFVLITVLLTITDLEAKLIPNRITFRSGPIAGAMLVAGALLDGDADRVVWAAIGAAGYFLFMLILALIVPGGLGFGDVKLAAILGAFVAAEHLGYVLVAAVGSYVIGGLTSAILLIFRLKSRKDTIPFGPYMVIAAYVALFFGQAIVDWYLG
jgi:leader peptidase (prepilin peptidase)/N-methyltransferase